MPCIGAVSPMQGNEGKSVFLCVLCVSNDRGEWAVNRAFAFSSFHEADYRTEKE